MDFKEKLTNHRSYVAEIEFLYSKFLKFPSGYLAHFQWDKILRKKNTLAKEWVKMIENGEWSSAPLISKEQQKSKKKGLFIYMLA